jgi:hypothetical protein
MLYGAAAARALHDGKTEAEVVELDNPRVNRHMSYADADAHGYYVVRLANDRCDVEFVAVQEPLVLPAEGETAVRRRVKFTLNAWTAGEPPELQLKEVVGNRPLGGLRG